MTTAVAEPETKPAVNTPAAQATPPVPTPAAAAPAVIKSLLAEAPAAASDKPAENGAVAEAAPAVEYKLKAPEKSSISADDLKAIETFAKEHKLSPEQAQKIVDRDATVAASRVESQQKEFNGLFDQWGGAIKADKDFGGEKLNANVEAVRRVVAQHADPEFKKMLEETPYGSHPGLFRMLARIGASMREDTSHTSSSQTPASEVHPKDILYPHFAKK